MSVIVNSDRLRREIARRGWNPVDLARAARISPATVSTALSGKPISGSSLNLIVQALTQMPTVDLIDRLLPPELPGFGVS